MPHLIENQLKRAAQDMRTAIAKVTDDGQRSALSAAMAEIARIELHLPSAMAAARTEAEIRTAQVAARELCHWAQNEDPRKVARLLEAIRGGHVSDLSLIF